MSIPEQTDRPTRTARKRRWGRLIIVIALCGVVAAVLWPNRKPRLTEEERRLIGNWTYTTPEGATGVFEFREDRTCAVTGWGNADYSNWQIKGEKLAITEHRSSIEKGYRNAMSLRYAISSGQLKWFDPTLHLDLLWVDPDQFELHLQHGRPHTLQLTRIMHPSKSATQP